MIELLWVVPALPFISSVILGFFGSKLSEIISGSIGTLSVFLATVLSWGIFSAWHANPPAGDVFILPLWKILNLPGLSIDVSLQLDPVSLLMMLVITTVGALIHLFSTVYMAEESGYSRFFAYLNLFIAAMLLLVLANNLLVLFIGWEGVGACSYLLVGFWFEDQANGYAARKSFVVTRIADTAMLMGILILAARFGTLEFQPLLAASKTAWGQGGLLPDVAVLLILLGGLGKSAQIPFQTWLPDAMAGPTPVSALIHAATMVTAGMYLVVRLHSLFLLSPDVLGFISLSAVATLLLASFTALVQTDIKRVLAYSTIAQIGYMFLALGVGAWAAAMFHFLTHAVFKALLFLTAGALAMRLEYEQNIFAMGGLWRRLPFAFVSFVVGASALAALPVVTAGAFSKEVILNAVWYGQPFGPLLWLAALLGGVVTATYIFRVVFVVFLGSQRHDCSGKFDWPVYLPLTVLAIGAVFIGWLETPEFLGGSVFLVNFLAPVLGEGKLLALPASIQIAGMVAPLLGIAIAYIGYSTGFWRYTASRPANVLERFAASGFGFDYAYSKIFVNPIMALTRYLRNDPVDMVFIFSARMAMWLHCRLRSSQVGQIRRYASWMMAGSIAAVAIVVFA